MNIFGKKTEVMMKKKGQWSFYFLSTDSSSMRRIKIPRYLLIASIVILGISLVGFTRSANFVISYTYSKLTMCQKNKEYKDLLKKISFYKKISGQYEEKIKEYVSLEDKARLKYGMNTLSETVRKAGIGGPPDLKDLLNESYEEPSMREASILERNLEALHSQIKLQDSTFVRMIRHINWQNDGWAQRPSIWPTRGKLTSGFGMRFHPFEGEEIFHTGLDIANRPWTPIVAPADGIVSFIGVDGYYGLAIVLNHGGSSYRTKFAHLQDVAVEKGQVVKRGDLLGYVGSTGRCTGPHLHYEVFVLDKLVNPVSFILPEDVIVN